MAARSSQAGAGVAGAFPVPCRSRVLSQRKPQRAQVYREQSRAERTERDTGRLYRAFESVRTSVSRPRSMHTVSSPAPPRVILQRLCLSLLAMRATPRCTAGRTRSRRPPAPGSRRPVQNDPEANAPARQSLVHPTACDRHNDRPPPHRSSRPPRCTSGARHLLLYALLQTHQLIPSRLLHRPGNARTHVGHGSAVLGGVHEKAGAGEALPPHILHQLAVIGGGFARSAADERRAQRHLWNALTQRLQDALMVCSRRPLHAPQHRVAGMLQRHVHVLDHRRTLGDGVDEVVGKVRRVAVQQPDPAQTKRHQRAHPCAPPSTAPPTATDRTVCCGSGRATAGWRRTCSGGRNPRPPADTRCVGRPADVADTRRETAPTPRPPAPARRGARRSRQERIDVLRQLRVRLEADHRVHLGQLGGQFASVPLRQAAGYDERSSARLLRLGHLQDGVDGFALRVLDEGAGVHHDNVGASGLVDDFIPVL
eukprot:ctg_365.g106